MENKYYYYKQQFSYENVRFLNEKKNTHTQNSSIENSRQIFVYSLVLFKKNTPRAIVRDSHKRHMLTQIISLY
jgi:hypothetical protein